jgi:cobalamin biosynthesis Mg chelatase CobN
MLALLASACFPVLAQAETVYKTESTNLPPGGGGNPPTHKNPGSPESSPEANQSNAPGGAGGDTNQPKAKSSKSREEASQGSNPSTPAGGGNAQGKQGNTPGGADKSPGATQMGEPRSSVTESDDGSSPLVPILIAVAVLAAISVGAVLVRQRRGSADGFSLKRS